MSDRDIIEVLQGEADLIALGQKAYEVHLPPLLREAAEEIKNLRIGLAWLYGLEVERPRDRKEQLPLALAAARKSLNLKMN